MPNLTLSQIVLHSVKFPQTDLSCQVLNVKLHEGNLKHKIIDKIIIDFIRKFMISYCSSTTILLKLTQRWKQKT